jgi:hypothetical protein
MMMLLSVCIASAPLAVSDNIFDDISADTSAVYWSPWVTMTSTDSATIN